MVVDVKSNANDPATRQFDIQPDDTIIVAERVFTGVALGQTGQAEFPTPFNTEKAPDGPMAAEEAARTMRLPPGFKCQVFAAEPDVQQPIAMAWDARGRLWIAECYTYAENPGTYGMGSLTFR